MKKNFFLYSIQHERNNTKSRNKMGSEVSKHVTSIKEALQHKSVASTFSADYKLISAEAHESVGSVFNKLGDNKILSVPIYDHKSKKFYAFLDLLDIVCNALELQQEYPLREKAGIEDEEFDNEPCLGKSDRINTE
jgi:hypothetical protein